MADRGSRPRLAYVPGLDGVRAVALLAVMAFHNFSWLPGGFYSVDTFFVLSGYLITSLLLTEWAERGTVRLRRFWGWRARRLLPAVFVLVAVLGIVAALRPSLFGPIDLLPNAVATVFYVANWYFVAHHVGYFSAHATSPLLHTWTLAIEEQFYLLWPLVVLAVLRLGRGLRVARVTTRRRRLDVLLGVCVAGAAASAVWMAVLTPAGSTTTRAYYGTDTRAQALLIGAALAVAFVRFDALGSDRLRPWFAALACLGVVGTGALWASVAMTSSLAFHGGFALASLATAGVIAGVVRSAAGPAARALGLAPLRALGRVTYGGYLWYWPTFLVLSAQRTGATGWLLFGERVAVTFGLAAVSYHLVEMPIRRGRLPGWRALVAAPIGAGVAIALVGISTIVPAAASTPHAAPPTAGAATTTAGPSSASADAVADAIGSSNVSSLRGAPDPVRVLMVGDSISGTLGVGLETVAARRGVEVVDVGAPGCSVSMDQLFRVLGYTVPPGTPCRDGDPAALFARWREWVDAYDPDVVVYVARGELFDQEVDGSWTDITDPSFDAYLTGRFEDGLDVLGARGAAVVVLTTPYYDSGEQSNGLPWPEDAPTRVVRDNALIRTVVAAAADRPGGTAGRAARARTGARGDAGDATGSGRFSVFGLNRLVSPGGRYAAEVDGVDLRCSDGVHFTAAGGRWVATSLLPYLERVARGHHARTTAARWPGTAPPPVPSWYHKLPCGPA